MRRAKTKGLYTTNQLLQNMNDTNANLGKDVSEAYKDYTNFLGLLQKHEKYQQHNSFLAYSAGGPKAGDMMRLARLHRTHGIPMEAIVDGYYTTLDTIHSQNQDRKTAMLLNEHDGTIELAITAILMNQLKDR